MRTAFIASIILAFTASQSMAAKKTVPPKKPPEVKEECIKSEAIEKVMAERVSLSDRKDIQGDELEKLRVRIKDSENVPNLPESTDRIQLYHSSDHLTYIIVLFHKECVQITARIPVKIFDKVLNEDGSI